LENQGLDVKMVGKPDSCAIASINATSNTARKFQQTQMRNLSGRSLNGNDSQYTVKNSDTISQSKLLINKYRKAIDKACQLVLFAHNAI
jgi:hypothetical protein